jgi:predicted enzyme related to lactoylglutathione lyase
MSADVSFRQLHHFNSKTMFLLTHSSFSNQSSNEAYTKVGIWIPVSDPTRAQSFYTAVFGWKCMETSSPSLLEGIKETYYFTKGGSLYGCFFLANEPKTTRSSDSAIGVHTVFSVKDVEESLVLIQKNGGKKHSEKTEIGPKMGYVAHFVDSEGNIMGVYASS